MKKVLNGGESMAPRISLWTTLRLRLLEIRGKKLSEKRNAFIYKEIKRGDIVLDCGANAGEITSKFAQMGATVHAFEPVPQIFKALAGKCEGLANVVLHEAAVGVADSRIIIFHPLIKEGEPLPLGASIIRAKSGGGANECECEVRLVDLHAFLMDLPPVKVLKMDIEGAEVDLLRDLAERGSLRRIGVVLVETHEGKLPGYEAKLRDLKSLLKELGYKNVYFNWI